MMTGIMEEFPALLNSGREFIERVHDSSIENGCFMTCCSILTHCAADELE